jgi:hypothetical protein
VADEPNTATDAAEKSPVEKAYQAGASLPEVQWPKPEEDDTRDFDKLRTPGVHHNPFDMRVPEQREEGAAWLRGLRDRLTAPTKSPEEIVGDIDAELGDE